MATKIVDLVKAKEEAKEPFVAFEYFPPRTDKGLENLYRRVQLMKHQAPMYVDVTWGAGGSTSDLTLDMCVKMKTEYGLEPNMHLTCTNMEAEKVDIALEGAKAANIANIVALRGDPPKGQEEWTATEGGFTCALDLIKYIREKHGDYFCLSTAGYPEGHPNVIKEVADASSLSESEKGRLVELDGKQFVCSDEDYGKEMAYLKAKVDAGADMIITQMFFDVPVFLTFVQDCRDAGITVPIVPGLMVIQAYGGFNRMTAFCKSRVPAWVRDSLEAVKDDEAAVKAQGIAIGTKMCQDLLAAGVVPLHFYCLNQEKATFAIMENLGMLKAAAEEEGATAAAAEATASA